jgi:hypothetical protein
MGNKKRASDPNVIEAMTGKSLEQWQLEHALLVKRVAGLQRENAALKAEKRALQENYRVANDCCHRAERQRIAALEAERRSLLEDYSIMRQQRDSLTMMNARLRRKRDDLRAACTNALIYLQQSIRNNTMRSRFEVMKDARDLLQAALDGGEGEGA